MTKRFFGLKEKCADTLNKLNLPDHKQIDDCAKLSICIYFCHCLGNGHISLVLFFCSSAKHVNEFAENVVCIHIGHTCSIVFPIGSEKHSDVIIK